MEKLRGHLGLLVAPIIWGIFADLSHGDIWGFFIRVIILYITGLLLLYVFDFIELIIRNYKKRT